MRRALPLVLCVALAANAAAAALVLDLDCGAQAIGDDEAPCKPFCGDCDDCVRCFRPLAIMPAAPVTRPSAMLAARRAMEGEREPASADARDVFVVPRA